MILVSRDETLFTLHTARSTYQMYVDEWGRLQHCYYGPRADGDLRDYFARVKTGFDVLPAEAPIGSLYDLGALPFEYSTAGLGDL